MAAPLHGLMAEFADHEALSRAVEATRAAGYGRLDVYAPFPMRDLARSLGFHPRILPWIALLAGAFGAALQYGSQYWMNAVDYPLNVGGRPLHAWPAFLPATIIVAILWAGGATLIGTLLILRLPRLHHPVFAAEGFERASQDRFFLVVRADDPLFDAAATARFLAALAPRRVQEVSA
ncbi:DUF3341 domain-containing protein [Enterovirga aerilata]|uniref:DUF3341 domain-containing protein n=1 Tax=Enterovirga aerilata TaxID=2730920 RepID=A0A849I2Y2_9HYPH|nr:DUF3341 domain-containing protein [Enterovirga sp. DB1703]NNM71718.1 DUF3341 domain-containing protein [Enterovirga sp. DB1703]